MWLTLQNTALFSVLLVVLIASTQERKVPKFLQKFNKSLGLSKNSEILWDILAIRNNTNQIKSLKERVDQLEECYNCTTKSKKFIPVKIWNTSEIQLLSSLQGKIDLTKIGLKKTEISLASLIWITAYS